MSRNEVQIRNFWSDVRVTRSNLPFRSRTGCENEMPSSNGGFGNKSQTTYAVIPIPQTRERDLTREAWITRANLCDPSAGEGSLTSFGMTRVLAFPTATPADRFRDRRFRPLSGTRIFPERELRRLPREGCARGSFVPDHPGKRNR